MSEPADSYDLVIVGGGTAGLVTAAGGAALGARTALVERDRLGGECLWTGCVPSKALIGSARLAAHMRHCAEFGFPESADREVERDAPPGPNANAGEGTGLAGSAAVLESVRAARARVQPHDDPERFREMGVDVVHGEGRLASPREVIVGERRLAARKVVLATGSRPAVPPVEGLEEAGYYTHETAFDRDSIPASVIILGAGAIGVEFAQAYRRLGTKVSLVEMAPRVLPIEDEEMGGKLREILEGEGVRVLTGARAVAAARADGGREVTVEREAAGGAPNERETLTADEIFVATGRAPNVEGLGLEEAGVETGPEGIRVDDALRTTRKGVFACGDVTGGYQFTHVADHEARTVLRNALFPFSTAVDYSVIPWTIFSDPELARVGLTEAEARERHGESVGVHRYDIAELDRAITDRRARGLVKLVADRKGRLLGAHVLAPSAGTMIVEAALAMRKGATLDELSDLVHPYPTMSEGIRRAANEYRRSRLTPGVQRWLDRWFRLSRRLGL